jgi:hypothetical protein
VVFGGLIIAPLIYLQFCGFHIKEIVVLGGLIIAPLIYLQFCGFHTKEIVVSFLKKAEFFLFFYPFPIKWLSGLLPLLVKPQAREDGQSHPSSAEINITWSCASLSQYNFM